MTRHFWDRSLWQMANWRTTIRWLRQIKSLRFGSILSLAGVIFPPCLCGCDLADYRTKIEPFGVVNNTGRLTLACMPWCSCIFETSPGYFVTCLNFCFFFLTPHHYCMLLHHHQSLFSVLCDQNKQINYFRAGSPQKYEPLVPVWTAPRRSNLHGPAHPGGCVGRVKAGWIRGALGQCWAGPSAAGSGDEADGGEAGGFPSLGLPRRGQSADPRRPGRLQNLLPSHPQSLLRPISAC